MPAAKPHTLKSLSLSKQLAELQAALMALPILTGEQAAVVLNMPPRSLHLLRYAGKGPAMFTIGKRLHIHTDDLKKWIAARSKDHDHFGERN